MRCFNLRGPAARTTLVGAAFTLVACSAQDRTSAADAATPGAEGPVPVVEVSATEYAFVMPDTIPSGFTSFRLTDHGREPHHLVLVRLDEGHSAEEFLRSMATPGAPPPAWATIVGGPNSPDPGGHMVSEVALELEPGNYLAFCAIPAPDGQPHVAKGMVKPFVVVPSEESAAPPEVDVDMRLVDYAYPTDRSISAGRRVIRVTNDAQQMHEVVFVRLHEGKTVEDLMAWEQNPAGPMPATMIGGTSPMSPGAVNYVIADFEPGEYLLVCFVPDAKDGRSHVAHGMVQTITVE